MNARAAFRLEVTRATTDWSPSNAKLSRWAQAALGARARGRLLGVRIVGRAESRRLNKNWRGKDRPTNVLSFPISAQQLAAYPSGTAPPLGDLVVCARVVASEAAEQGKRLEQHWAHLVVHGSLHLIGFDHELGAPEQIRMERREIRVLRALGVPNPYVSRLSELRE
jgi:probable rRNA maturation factor